MADITQTASNVRAQGNASIQDVIAGVSVSPGEFLYQDTADSNKWKKADTATDTSGKEHGMCLSYGDDTDTISVVTAGTVEIGGTTVAGTVYGASDTAGNIRPVSDNASSDYVTIFGVASDTSGTLKLNFYASGVQV